MNVSRDGWVWYGYPMHFMGAERCVYHLGTSIAGKWLVSTVGHYLRDPIRSPNVRDDVSPGALFETMVFEIAEHTDQNDPIIESWGGVETYRYQGSREAEAGHYAVCIKYDDMARAESAALRALGREDGGGLMDINAYLAEQHRELHDFLATGVVPAIYCRDGFRLSVQASRSHYCTPRRGVGPWTHVEVGLPNRREEALMPYIESPDEDPTGAIYGYVPVDVVEAIVAQHGGHGDSKPGDGGGQDDE